MLRYLRAESTRKELCQWVSREPNGYGTGGIARSAANTIALQNREADIVLMPVNKRLIARGDRPDETGNSRDRRRDAINRRPSHRRGLLDSIGPLLVPLTIT